MSNGGHLAPEVVTVTKRDGTQYQAIRHKKTDDGKINIDRRTSLADNIELSGSGAGVTRGGKISVDDAMNIAGGSSPSSPSGITFGDIDLSKYNDVDRRFEMGLDGDSGPSSVELWSDDDGEITYNEIWEDNPSFHVRKALYDILPEDFESDDIDDDALAIWDEEFGKWVKESTGMDYQSDPGSGEADYSRFEVYFHPSKEDSFDEAFMQKSSPVYNAVLGSGVSNEVYDRVRQRIEEEVGLDWIDEL